MFAWMKRGKRKSDTEGFQLNAKFNLHICFAVGRCLSLHPSKSVLHEHQLNEMSRIILQIYIQFSLSSCPLIFVIRILHIQYTSIEQTKNGIQRDYPIHCGIRHLQTQIDAFTRMPTIISRLLRLVLCFDLFAVDEQSNRKLIYNLLMMMANGQLTRPFQNGPMLKSKVCIYNVQFAMSR